jgi:hypothetical protein
MLQTKDENEMSSYNDTCQHSLSDLWSSSSLDDSFAHIKKNSNFLGDNQNQDNINNGTKMYAYIKSPTIRGYNNENIIDNPVTRIANWNKFKDLLNKSLNLFAFRDVTILIEEFIKLETYLLNEYKLYEKEESDLSFQSPQQIFDFLNKNLQVTINNLN